MTFQLYPSFWEFVQYILHENVIEEHWEPITRYCLMCLIQYQMIVHFENLETESLDLLDYLSPKRLNRKSMHDLLKHYKFRSSNLTESNLTKLYFRQLSDDEINGLRKFYQNDFEFFGYDSFKF